MGHISQGHRLELLVGRDDESRVLIGTQVGDVTEEVVRVGIARHIPQILGSGGDDATNTRGDIRVVRVVVVRGSSGKIRHPGEDGDPFHTEGVVFVSFCRR